MAHDLAAALAGALAFSGRLETYISGDRTRGAAGLEHLAFHRDPSAGRLLVGGNRSGKTTTGAVESVWWLTGTHPFRRAAPPPVRGRCVSPELPGPLDKAHVARDSIRMWVSEHLLRGGSWATAYSIQGHTLHFANGSFIEFLSSEQDLDKHAGAGLSFVWLDEECSKPIWQENMARLATGAGAGAWWMTYTPIAGLAWIEEELYRPGLLGEIGVSVFEVTTYDNAHNLAPGAIELLETQFPDERDRQVRLLGKYGRRQGLVYDIFGPQHLAEIEVVVTE